MIVAELFAALGLKTDGVSFAKAEAAMRRVQGAAVRMEKAVQQSSRALQNATHFDRIVHGLMPKSKDQPMSWAGLETPQSIARNAKASRLEELEFDRQRFVNRARTDKAESVADQRRIRSREREELVQERINRSARATQKARAADEKHFDGILSKFERSGAKSRGRATEESAFPGSLAWQSKLPGKTKDSKDGFGPLNTLVAGISVMGTVRIAKEAISTIAELGDEYNAVANALKLLTTNTAQQTRLQNMLFASAQRTGVTFSSLSVLYQQLGKAAVEQGLSLESAVGLVETVTKASRMASISPMATKQGLRQLAEGMAEGKLHGRQLQSVMREIPAVADLIAKHFHVARGKLMELGKAGKLTSPALIAAFQEQAASVDVLHKQRIVPLSESFARLHNTLTKAFGEMLRDPQIMNTLTGVIHLTTDALQHMVNVFGFLIRQKNTVLGVLGAITIALIAMKWEWIKVRAAAMAAWLAEMGPVGWAAMGIGAIAMLRAYMNDRNQTESAALPQTQTFGFLKQQGGAGTTVNIGPPTFNIHSATGDPEEISKQVNDKFSSFLVDTQAAQ